MLGGKESVCVCDNLLIHRAEHKASNLVGGHRASEWLEKDLVS